jgi:tRNA(fMet)-specific endonuclease VapC
MRGWLSAIKKQPYAADQVPLYPRLMQLVEFYSQWDVLPFDSRSADTYLGLRKQKVRVGTADLKIASIALVNNALLLTANLVDFQKIPGLRVEDWLYG